MPKPETLVIKRVRSALEARAPYVTMEKTNNPYISGILDLEFEAWRFVGKAEVKYRPLKVKAGEIVDLTSTIKQVSDLQLARFRRHLQNEIPCFLLVGFEGPNARNRSYAIAIPDIDSEDELYWPETTPRASTVDEVVDWIINWVESYQLDPL